MQRNNLIIIIAAVIIAGGAGFWGGITYQKSKTPRTPFGQFRAGNGMVRPTGFQNRNGFTGGRPVSGEITSMENNTLTVKDQDGNSKIVIFSDSTAVNKTASGSKEDLKVGEQILVIGTAGNDGTVMAQTISVGGRMFPGSPTGQPSQ